MDMFRHFQPIVYVKLQPSELTVKDVKSGKFISGPPVAAISREAKKRLLGVGKAAQLATTSQPADLINPFLHPRSLIWDFGVAQAVMKGFFKQLFEGRFFVPSPIVVLHPKVDPEGGFTQIEIRALHELAIGVGASKVYVWQGRELLDGEVGRLSFDSGGKVLN